MKASPTQRDRATSMEVTQRTVDLSPGRMGASAQTPTYVGESLPSFAQLRAFEAVGRLLGIRKAAAALQLHHAVVSRHLRSIEDWAGVRLFKRTGLRLELTIEGQRFHRSIG